MPQVHREFPDRLKRQTWRFTVGTCRGQTIDILLSYYAVETRKTTRHNWRSERETRFSATEPRAYYSGLVESQCPIPDDVWKEACDQIKFVRMQRPDRGRGW